MTITQKQVITVWLTPDDLRKIAHILEENMRRVKLGEDLPSYTIVGQGIDIKLTHTQGT